MGSFKDAVLSYRKEKAMRFLQQVFSNYYRESPPKLPESAAEREWGFFPFIKGGMRRHVAFGSEDEAKDFFINETPRHAYYSAAFYKYPGASKMEEKIWQGAELIFDLDADHIQGAEKMSYEEQLKGVKKEVIKLIDNYVLDSFGFDEKYVELYFSGGRGYHIHVKDPTIYKLGSKERRELVDFIMASGLDDSWLFPKKPLDRKSFYHRGTDREHVTIRFTKEMPSPNDPGWKGIVGKGIRQLADDMETRDKKDVLGYYRSVINANDLHDQKGNKYGKATIESTYDDLFEGTKGKRGVDKIRRGIFEVFSKDRNRDFFMDFIKIEARVNLAGETDQPVTTDTHRLIRVPGSLHGKTGFCVVPIDLDMAVNFDPLTNAVVLPDDEITIEFIRSGKIRLKGSTFDLPPGIHDLPTYAGVFFLASGAAILPKETFGTKALD